MSICEKTTALLSYILESNPHPFYSFRGLKIQMRIAIECGLDSRSRAGVWPNDRAGVRAVRTIQGGKTRCGLDSRIYGISQVHHFIDINL
jgi:hypothetical protein